MARFFLVLWSACCVFAPMLLAQETEPPRSSFPIPGSAHVLKPLQEAAAPSPEDIDFTRFKDCEDNDLFWEDWRRALLKVRRPQDFNQMMRSLHDCLLRKEGQRVFQNKKLLSQDPAQLGCLDRTFQLLRLRNLNGGSSGRNISGQEVIPPFRDLSREESDSERSVSIGGLPQEKNEYEKIIQNLIEYGDKRFSKGETSMELLMGDSLNSYFAMSRGATTQKRNADLFNTDLTLAINQSFTPWEKELPEDHVKGISTLRYDALKSKVPRARPFQGGKISSRVVLKDGRHLYVNLNHFPIHPNQRGQGAVLIDRQKDKVRFVDVSAEPALGVRAQSHPPVQLACMSCHADGDYYKILDPSQSKIYLAKSPVISNKNKGEGIESLEAFNDKSNIEDTEERVNVFSDAQDAFVEYGLPPFGSKIDNELLQFCITQYAGPLSGLSAKEKRDLGTAMNCSSCHAGNKKNFPIYTQYIGMVDRHADPIPEEELRSGNPTPLTWLGLNPFDVTLRNHIQHDSMPHGQALNQTQKDILQECLMTQYFGSLYDPNAPPNFNGELIQKLTEVECL